MKTLFTLVFGLFLTVGMIGCDGETPTDGDKKPADTKKEEGSDTKGSGTKKDGEPKTADENPDVEKKEESGSGSK